MKAGALTPFVALLRGVNVGAANRITNEALRRAFADAGAANVETLLQSGNVVFVAPAGKAPTLVERARAEIARTTGVSPPIVLRDADAWRRLIADNPFIAAGADVDKLHVACLSATPEIARVAQLESDRSPPDVFAVVGANVYLYLPNGVARSKLTNAWLDARLSVVSTARNWRTATKLAAMIEARA